ncbi:MAG: glycoside hydrolase family 13 protein [Lachnospiraceae bacterium]|nr:glycoside hydrolase family 13 protein [Lachnospiraceae bacterium]
MNIYHNTRELKFREPFGAVFKGTDVVLRLFADDEGISNVSLIINTKTKNNEEHVMKKEEDCIYSYVLVPDSAELYSYYFVISYCDGKTIYYGPKKGRVNGGGMTFSEPIKTGFQLTVTKPSYSPCWYKNGIVYQIFPDRFARGDDYLENAKEDFSHHLNGPKRTLTDDWLKKPVYEKDSLGKITKWEFYGGTLKGIIDKLDYIKDLGATIIYLNPIFDAASNHRYDTADYMKISPLLGTEKDFKDLCDAAKKKGIKIILDGVFNHTGCDSIYFNKYNNYDTIGAYNSEKSPYRDWYTFNDSKDGYESWWGVGDLPAVNEKNESYRKYIYEDPDSVVRHYIKEGAKGWRLDVADELPDSFIAGIKKAMKETDPDCVLLGEVWEDASNKVAYDELREYFLGDELDCVMNYPLRDNMIAFLNGEIDANELAERFMSLYENYPKDAFYSNFNLLGSHDSKRLYTSLGGNVAHIKSAVTMQMCFPGVPVIYYGDEIGYEGGKDPENRAAFDLSLSKNQIMDIYKEAIALRREDEIFLKGDFKPFALNHNVFCVTRQYGARKVRVIINRSGDEDYDFYLDGKNCHVNRYETLVLRDVL